MPVDYSNWDAFEDSDASDSEDEPMTEAEIRAESDRVARESVEANEMLKLRYPNGTDDDVEFPPKHLDEETRKKLMEMQPGGEKVLQAARDFKKKLKADREAGNDPRTAAERFARQEPPRAQTQPATWAERVASATETKAHANSMFTEGTAGEALPGYLAAIWLLKAGATPYPAALRKASGLLKPNPPRGAAAAALLGDGADDEPVVEEVPAEAPLVEDVERGGGPDDDALPKKPPPNPDLEWDSDEDASAAGDVERPPFEPAPAVGPPDAAALRLSLHLNVALAALKLEDYALAEAACGYVLDRDEGHVKATYRLAMACEGQGRFKRALKLLTRVCKRDPKNADARDARKKIKARLEDLRWQYGDWLETENKKLYKDQKDWQPPPTYEGKVIPPQGLYKRTYYLHPLAKRVLVLTGLAVASLVCYACWGTLGPLIASVRAGARPWAAARLRELRALAPVAAAAAKRGVLALFDAGTWTRQALASGASSAARSFAGAAVEGARAAARGAAAAVRGLGAFLFSRPGYRKKARRAASS